MVVPDDAKARGEQRIPVMDDGAWRGAAAPASRRPGTRDRRRPRRRWAIRHRRQPAISDEPARPTSTRRGSRRGDGPGDRRCERRVPRRLIVERAVRLHVREAYPFCPGHAEQRRYLIEHEVFDLARSHAMARRPKPWRSGYPGCAPMHRPAAAARRIVPANDGGVTRVEAAGDVHRGDVREKRRIVAERPCAERLAGVGVQVDAHAGTPKKGKGTA